MGVLQTIYGGATGNGTQNEQTAFDRDLNEGNLAQNQGGALQDRGGGLVDQFGQEYTNQTGVASGYRGQADNAYQNLQQTPGYNATQSAAITGNPNAGFNYYNPDELKGDTASYGQDLNTAASRGQQYLQAAPDNETAWQGGINSKLENSGNQAVSGLQGALGHAVSGYGTNLDNAVDPSKLTVGSQLDGYQLTPEQAQNIKNVGAQAAQGQYRKMAQQAEMTANAQGNTSPAALAAIESQLGRQGAIDAGNVASSAELSANNAAADRKLTATQTNLGANQNLAGLQSQNAGNLYNAQSGAANQLYGAQQGTASNLANTETSANQHIANTQGNAATQEANLGYNAAQTGGAQKIATDTGLQSTGQNLAVGADNSASNRATTIGNTALAGEKEGRNYLTGQQGAAQTAQTTAGNQQLSGYGGTTSAFAAQHGSVNNANAAAGNVAVGANSQGQNLQGSFLADGGTFGHSSMPKPDAGFLDEYGGQDNTDQNAPADYAPTTVDQPVGNPNDGLARPEATETPDIFKDYREQINSNPVQGSSTSNTSLNLSVNGPGSSGVDYGGDNGSFPSSGGSGGGLYSTIGNPGWGSYGGGSGIGYGGSGGESTGGSLLTSWPVDGGETPPGGWSTGSNQATTGGSSVGGSALGGGLMGWGVTLPSGGGGDMSSAIDNLRSGYRINPGITGYGPGDGSGSWGDDDLYYGDGGTSTGTRATVGERGPEAIISTKPSRYAAIGKEIVSGLGHMIGGRHPQQPMQQAPSAPTPPQSTSSKIADTVGSILGGRYLADGGTAAPQIGVGGGQQGYVQRAQAQQNSARQSLQQPQKPAEPQSNSRMEAIQGAAPQQPSARMDGSSVPGNQPGGQQGQNGWMGPAARSMAAGGPAGGAPAMQGYQSPQRQQSRYSPQQGQSTHIFTRPTNVMLGTNGSTDTVVPLNPGPNAKVTPSQMGMGQEPQQPAPYADPSAPNIPPDPGSQQQAPNPRMPSRYRPATGPKGMNGPQLRPIGPRQGTYAA